MKIITFGTCRVTMLFDNKNSFIESQHCLNNGCFGDKNIISLSQDIYQALFLLKLIKEKRHICSNDIDYNLLTRMLVFIQNKADYRDNLLSVNKDYNINNSIINIYNELNNIEYIIIEVCTLKQLIINNIPLFLDINNISDFNIITDEEFNNNFDNLVNYIETINKNIKIIFVSHIITYKQKIVPDRNHILLLLNENVKKFKNCYVINPSDYIIEDDLIDDRHYKLESKYKIVTAIENKILDIESQSIVDKLNNTGIMKFNLLNFLNHDEYKKYNDINTVLDNMIIELQNNNKKQKKFDENNYMYIVNNYLQESFNLNNDVFKNFFTIVLNSLVVKIAEKYLESKVYIYNPIMAINYNSNDNRVQSQHWHRDPGGRKIIKFLFFFDKVNELNGSLEYIPNTQYTSLSKLTNIFDFGDSRSIYPNILNDKNLPKFIDISNNNKLITECNNYDVLSVDTSGFHRAGICSKNFYRKYLHVLFLTKQNIDNNNDPCDLYQNGFNYNKICNVDINNINNILNKNVSEYFYK